MDRNTMEERIAHLLREADELSDIVANQRSRIERLERQVAALTERERAREAETGAVLLSDEQPPHW